MGGDRIIEPPTSFHVSKLDYEGFVPFGRVIASDDPGFSSVFTPPQSGPWLVGVNNVTTQLIDSLHRHFDTWECFTPTSGSLYIAVAPASTSSEDLLHDPVASVRVFEVTVPICVAPRTWHTLLTRSSGSAIVFENATVTGESIELPSALTVRW